MRGVVWLFFVLGLVGLIIIGVLLGTEPGMRLIGWGAEHASDGRITVGSVHGRLLGGLQLEDVHVDAAGTEVDISGLEWNWHPACLARGEFHVARLSVSGVKIRLPENEQKKPPSVGSIAMPRLLMPLALAVDRFSVDGVQLFGGAGDRLMTIDAIGGRLAGHGETLAITDFSLDAPGIGFSMHGDIDLGDRWDLDLMGSWWVSDYGFHPIGGTFSLFGPLNSPKVTFGVNSSGGIQVVGQVQNLLERPEWTATVSAWHADLSVLIEHCPEIKVKTFSARVAGDTAGYRGHATAEVDWGRQKDMHLDTHLTADWMGIVFDTLRVDSGEASATAEGSRISWRNIFDWQGKFHFVNFDPSVFTEGLPGRVTADFTNRGDVRDDYGVDVSFAVDRLNGTLHGQPIAATGTLQLTENDIKTDGLTIKSGEFDGIAFIDRARISWIDQVAWDAAVRLKDFDPAGLFPEFSGRINGEFAGSGKFTDRGPEGYVKVRDISGNLRGQELSGEGEISLVDEALRTKGFFLRSGESELMVKGQAGDDFALDFTFFSPDIGKLLPDSDGDVKLTGRLRGSPEKPLVDVDLAGTALRYRGTGFADLKAGMHVGLWSEGKLKGFVSGARMQLPGLSLDRGRIDVAGTIGAPAISLSAVGPEGELKMRATAVHRDNWIGDVADLELTTATYGTWRQQRKSSFAVVADTFSLKQLCIGDGHGTICAGGELQLAEALRWKVNAALEAVSVDWLNRLKLVRTPVSGTISADISAAGTNRRISSATTAVSLPDAAVMLSLKDHETSTIQFHDSRLSLQMADSRLAADLSTSVQNGGRIRAVADIPNAGDLGATFANLPLGGRLELSDFNLAAVSAITGFGVEPTGRVNGSFVLGGTVGKPVLTGTGRIEDGGIALPYQGVVLEHVRATIEAREDAAKISCRATSGPGELRAEGILRYGDSGIEGVLHVRGKNFLLVNLPEYAFRVTPDVLFRFNRHQGEISGVVKVPYGMITPEEMTDAVKISEDVVLVNGRNDIREGGWPFALDLDVQVGDDVRIDGYGLAGRLTGALNIKTKRDEQLTGKGELDLVNGTFTLYGRTLDIERGRVLFTGGLIENPGVDVRAQKKVGEEEAKNKAYTVGVDISGLVRDLKYHLFSDPHMDDTEILSMMIVGHSLADSSEEDSNLIEAAAVTLGLKGNTGFIKGIGSILQLDDLHLEGTSSKENVSLVVGKRVTRDLYIGYDINMFSQLGEFRVRYDLKKGFSIETRSSSQSTGADFLYSFEK